MVSNYQTKLNYVHSLIRSGEYTLNRIQRNKVSRYFLRHHELQGCIIPLTHRLWKDLNVLMQGYSYGSDMVENS